MHRISLGAAVLAATTVLLASVPATAATESGLRVLEVGTWVNNTDEIFYIRVDREIVGGRDSEESCSSNLIKVLLNSDSAQPANADAVRQLAIAALLSGRQVRMSVRDDRCLYGNPTIESFYLVAK